MNTIDTASTEPLGHDEALDLQQRELELTVELLQSLSADDWSARTDCPAWDVTDMYRHVLGACEAGASMRQNAHQLVAARRHRRKHGGPLEAGLSHVQVVERADLGPAEIVERLAAIISKTIAGRRRVPSLIRNHAKLAIDGPVHEQWTMGYLIDTIYLRDLWMHRIDTTQATGREMQLSADHDGRIVADVVREWAQRHGQPFRLELSGPAGGTFADGSGDAEALELDAVEFCRILAGRAPAEGLLTTIVPF